MLTSHLPLAKLTLTLLGFTDQCVYRPILWTSDWVESFFFVCLQIIAFREKSQNYFLSKPILLHALKFKYIYRIGQLALLYTLIIDFFFQSSCRLNRKKNFALPHSEYRLIWDNKSYHHHQITSCLPFELNHQWSALMWSIFCRYIYTCIVNCFQ